MGQCRGLITRVILLLSAAQGLAAEQKLQFVVVMSRHGVRSPLWSQDRQNRYSAQPWPAWDVKPGILTAHGRLLMGFMGDYYRQYFTKAGLLPPSGCAAAQRFYFWSDTDERDIDSGHALAEHMFRGCPMDVHTVTAGRIDPLFNAIRAGVGKPDPDAAVKAVGARVGGSPDTLAQRYRSQLDEMQKVLGSGATALMAEPTSLKPDASYGVALSGPVSAAAEIADMFMLEYTEDRKTSDLGWGRVTKSKLLDFLMLQDAYVDLTLRTPYLAQASGSNLMSHILKSLQQAASGSPVTGALGQPGDQGLYLLGHDSNESNLEALLGTSWSVPGFAPNTRPPGSALVFELWKESASGSYTVRSWFITQTLDQMRNSVPLSLEHAPARVPLSIPGCPQKACEWATFQTVVGAAIAPSSVSNDPLQ